MWKAHVGELWRRTVIRPRRELARGVRARGTTVRLSYAKVAEAQRHGVVHLHALLRLDDLDPADKDQAVPPAGVVLGELVDVTEAHPGRWLADRLGLVQVHQAVSAVSA